MVAWGLGWCEGQSGVIAKGYRVPLCGDENVLKLWSWLHISVNILKTTGLYTLNK